MRPCRSVKWLVITNWLQNNILFFRCQEKNQFFLIFLYNLDFQVVEIHMFYEIILVETGLAVVLEVLDILIQPDGFLQI